MRIFLRSSYWVIRPPLPALLSTLSRLVWPAPALARSATPFAFALGLLAGLAFGPQRAWGQTTNCSATAATLSYSARAAGESWVKRASAGVPTVYAYTKAGTTYTTSNNAGTTSLQTAQVNGGQSLAWSATFNSAGSTATVVYTFNHAVAGLSIRVQDIDGYYNSGALGTGLGNHGFIDQVTFTGVNGAASVPPR